MTTALDAQMAGAVLHARVALEAFAGIYRELASSGMPQMVALAEVSKMAQDELPLQKLGDLVAFAAYARVDQAFEDAPAVDALQDQLNAALELLDEVESSGKRNHLAWQHARQRAADHLAALVESDAERDHLAVQLRERDEDVRDLANRLAEFCGITS